MSLPPNTKIYVAGHHGMVGRAVTAKLRERGCENLVLRTRRELDLTDASAVDTFYAEARPEVVIVAAAKVGGIHANATYPADFMRENLAMELNLIDGARRHGVGRLLFLGSSCIYPREAPQPMTEDVLLTSPLEATNEAYALAKIAGLKLCQYYRSQYGMLFHSAMPTNLYGPGDNYHSENSHVLPALIRRFHEAKVRGDAEVTIWGTGKPRREFLHTEDLAEGLLHLLALDDPPDWVNIGTGEDIEIGELARLVARVTGFGGRIAHDTSKPDGTPRKLLDISRIRATGWSPRIALEDGIAAVYEDFKTSFADGTARL
ncbi:MAG: GDP-L-fucose synthase [Opitutales bacterium]|nr:GDP-L-fucose synthase [Opitutales bacterium]